MEHDKLNNKKLAEMPNQEKVELVEKMNRIIQDAASEIKDEGEILRMDLSYIGAIDYMKKDAENMSQEEFSKEWDREIVDVVQEALFQQF